MSRRSSEPQTPGWPTNADLEVQRLALRQQLEAGPCAPGLVPLPLVTLAVLPTALPVVLQPRADSLVVGRVLGQNIHPEFFRAARGVPSSAAPSRSPSPSVARVIAELSSKRKLNLTEEDKKVLAAAEIARKMVARAWVESLFVEKDETEKNSETASDSGRSYGSNEYDDESSKDSGRPASLLS